MKGSLILIIFLMTGFFCMAKKINLKKDTFETAISFIYKDVIIITDKKKFDLCFQNYFSEPPPETCFAEIITQSKNSSVISISDSSVFYIHEFLEKQLDKGNVILLMGPLKQKAKYITRKTYGTANIKKRGCYYYFENYLNTPFYHKILNRSIIDF